MLLVLPVPSLELFRNPFLLALFLIMGQFLHLKCHCLTYILSLFSSERVFSVPYVNCNVQLSVMLSWSEMWNTNLVLRYLELDPAADEEVYWLVHYFALGEGY